MQCNAMQQSDVEETIERIKSRQGVEGYVICNNAGQVLRRFPALAQDHAAVYAETMRALATQARSVVRDLNPRVRGLEECAGTTAWGRFAWFDLSCCLVGCCGRARRMSSSI